MSKQYHLETLPSFPSPIPIMPLTKNSNYESNYHSSKIKRPTMHFDIIGQNSNFFDINIGQDIDQSFKTVNPYNKMEENFFNNNKNNIDNNGNNNNINKNLSILNINKSVQQGKYDNIKNYCLKKNDPDNYPLISYENFLLIDSLCEKNTSEFEPYKNFLFNKNASIELFSKFCTLLMNRYLLSKLKKYPKVVYQIIFDVNNIYNYLSPDIVADAKQSNMFICLINYENKWNVLVINKNNNLCNYFMFNKNMDKEIILVIINTITKSIYPYVNFQLSVSDYSDFSDNNQIILPFIIMDFFSRYRSDLPIDDEDYYYQTILILSEILTNNLITK